MSTEQKDLEQNALAARMNNAWDSFKQGKLIGYKVMAVLLILVAAVGCVVYILVERGALSSNSWRQFSEANTLSGFEEISKARPNTIEDRLARLAIARNQLGAAGIEQLSAFNPEQKKKAIENIEKARESFGKLAEEFKKEPICRVECLLGQAKSEAVLATIPLKDGSMTEFKGDLSKVVDLLDQVANAAAPDTPWATQSKKLADALRDPNSPSRHEFVRVQQALSRGILGGGEPFAPPPKMDIPGSPFKIPGLPEDPTLPKGPGPKAPLAPIIPEAPAKGTTPTPEIVPPTAPGTTPPAKDPANPGPVGPGPKPAEKGAAAPSTTPTPPAPDPKAPTPPEKK
jgi:hypothetical protein